MFLLSLCLCSETEGRFLGQGLVRGFNSGVSPQGPFLLDGSDSLVTKLPRSPVASAETTVITNTTAKMRTKVANEQSQKSSLILFSDMRLPMMTTGN